MPTIEDLYPFLPYAMIAVCLVVGKAMKGATRIPDWLIPPVLAGTGAVIGAAEAVTLGTPWKQAALTACSGLIAVGLHQTGRSASRQDNGPPPATPKPDAGKGDPPQPTGLTLRERFGRFVLWAAVVMAAGCTPAQKAEVKTALDVSGAICDELPEQSEPAAVLFTCTVIGVADGAAHVFLARVTKADAPALEQMRARSAKPCRGGSVGP